MLSWSPSIDPKRWSSRSLYRGQRFIVVSGTEYAIGTLRGKGIEEALVEEEKGVVSKKVTSAETKYFIRIGS